MRVHLIQYGVTDLVASNQADAERHVLRLLDQIDQADLILLPEIWNIGYHDFDAYAASAQFREGALFHTLRAHALRLQAYLHMGSFVEHDAEKLFNCSVVINPQGEISGYYRKIHVFGYQSQEQRLLTAGSDICVIKTEHGVLGLSCCYDLRFPELYRQLQEQGVEIFCVCAAWPAERLDAWRLFCRARAHENLAYLLSCNCAGQSKGIAFAGHSMVIDSMGAIVAEAGNNEEILTVDIDIEMLRDCRKKFPFLEDRMIIDANSITKGL